jgi:hypothetical protein
MKSFKSAVFSAEDLDLINNDLNGREPHSPGKPVPPINAVISTAPSTNCNV